MLHWHATFEAFPATLAIDVYVADMLAWVDTVGVDKLPGGRPPAVLLQEDGQCWEWLAGTARDAPRRCPGAVAHAGGLLCQRHQRRVAASSLQRTEEDDAAVLCKHQEQAPESAHV